MRRLHKAFLRYHDPNNWPVLREALRRMGRADLIGSGATSSCPPTSPPAPGAAATAAGQGAGARPFRTQHTGLPHTPRAPAGRRPKAR